MFIAGRNFSLPAIYACDHEVTQGEYETYCKYGDTVPDSTYGMGANYPAYYVSWYDAIVYCNLKSAADGLTPCYKQNGSNSTTSWTLIGSEDGKYCGPARNNDSWNTITCDFTANGWRLPTEAEWEMLARGGNLTNTNQTTYSGSDTIGDVAWYGTNSGTKAHEVKTNKVENKDSANALSLYDMSGNVMEWCWDFRNTIGSDTPWTGPDTASYSFYRVFRGGGFGATADKCSVAHRLDNYPSNRSSSIGFRVVRSAASN